MNRVLLAAGIFCVVVSGIGFGQGFTAGDKTFTIAGIGNSSERFADNDLAFSAEMGWFVTDAWEFSIRQGIVILDIPGSDDDWAGTTSLALDYNFNMGSIVPFVGFNAGYQYGDVEDGCLGGPEAGLRWFMNDTTYLQFRAEYACSTVFDDELESGYTYTLGVGFRF